MDSANGDRHVHELPNATSVLAVCAHPDDESFGLGAALDAFGAAGASTAVLCFTHGESSTFGADRTELGEVRAAELAAAAAELGVEHVELLDYADGRLNREPVEQLAKHDCQAADRVRPDVLLVFDEGGVTGHLDHSRATDTAVAFARGYSPARIGVGGRPARGHHLEPGVRRDVRRSGRPRTWTSKCVSTGAGSAGHHPSCESGDR